MSFKTYFIACCLHTQSLINRKNSSVSNSNKFLVENEKDKYSKCDNKIEAKFSNEFTKRITALLILFLLILAMFNVLGTIAGEKAIDVFHKQLEEIDFYY